MHRSRLDAIDALRRRVAPLGWEGATIPEVPSYAFSPYCGAPPSPQTWLARWNLDPILIAVLLAGLVAYLALVQTERWRKAAFVGGWALGALAVISPLCALSVSLFCARTFQHMWLASVVAPLIALGRPQLMLRRLSSRPASRIGHRPVLAAAAFAGALWFWQAPAAYAATFQSDAVYWAMHLTTFAAAVWLWSGLLDDPHGALGRFALATLITTCHMGLLGALITFAGRPLYAPHFGTTYAWGFTPLADQQLGGVVMWIPAGLLMSVGFGWAFLQTLRRAELRQLERLA
jgi:putative membrane protein